MSSRTHPVEVGNWGKFIHGGDKLVNLWQTLEEIWAEDQKGWVIGVYSGWNILDWAKEHGLLLAEEIALLEGAMC